MSSRNLPIYNGPVFDAHNACVFFVNGQVHVGLSDSRWSFRCFGKKSAESIEEASAWLKEVQIQTEQGN